MDSPQETAGVLGTDPLGAPPPDPAVPWWAALLALPLVLVAFLLLSQIARGVAIGVLRALGTPGPLEEHPVAILAAMSTGSLLLMVVALALPLFGNRSPVRTYRVCPAPLAVFAAAAVGTFSLGPLGDVLMVTLAEHFPDATLGSVPRLHDLAREQGFVVLWPFFALLPGLSEELFFRGFVQSSFGRTGVAVFISALAFAAFHLDPHHMVGVFPLGLFLAWVANRFGVLVTMVAHTVNNTVALATLQVAELDVGYGTAAETPLWWVSAGIALTAGSAAVLLRFSRARPPAASPASPTVTAERPVSELEDRG